MMAARMKGRGLALLLAIALGGCGGIGEDDMTAALETAWSEDAPGMAKLTGTDLPGAEPGELRGVASSAKVVTDLARGYAGDVGGDLAAGVIDGASSLAEDFGVEGAGEVRDAIGIATASEWKIRNLEVLSQRESGDDQVVSLRYDLNATMQGAPVTIARDITHEVRFLPTDDGWRVERTR